MGTGRVMRVFAIKIAAYRKMVAASTRVQAATLLGVTIGSLRSYGSETQNEEERTVALSKPGVVWKKSAHTNEPWATVG